MGVGRCLAACAIGAVALTACGRLDFTPRGGGPGGGGGDGGGGADAPPPTGHAGGVSMVESNGVANTAFEADGTHMVFVDNTPGAAGDLVVFREGEGTTALGLDVSGDGGATWTGYTLSPSNTTGVNALGACQDTVGNAFHVSWLDTSVADQYARLAPKHAGGHIVGFDVVANFGFFDDFEDSPGPRDLAEIIDAAGNHRVAFAGTANTGSSGRYKLALTSPTVGLAPASQNDWGPASALTADGTDDQLLPNSYTTADGPNSYMISIASNLAGGAGAPIIVVGGFPMDQQLLAWTITPGGTAVTTYAVGAARMMSTSFGGGTGARFDASLGVATAPDGGVLIVHDDDAKAAAPGLHVSRVDPSGAFDADAVTQPTVNIDARHAMIAADAESRPVVMAIDGGQLVGELHFGDAWLPEVTMGPAQGIAGAWPVADAWRPGGVESFGAYLDAGSGMATTFESVSWQ